MRSKILATARQLAPGQVKFVQSTAEGQDSSRIHVGLETPNETAQCVACSQYNGVNDLSRFVARSAVCGNRTASI